MNLQPSRLGSRGTALLALLLTVLGALRVFGVDLTEEQSAAIMGVAGAAGLALQTLTNRTPGG